MPTITCRFCGTFLKTPFDCCSCGVVIDEDDKYYIIKSPKSLGLGRAIKVLDDPDPEGWP